ncbi:HigA family addiction module antitoxin, partial [Gordonia sp. (in: high G+C Gram-positive bacteria)]|uniref:HigA family addiction module antitoxin n=1 Tax=Gordonia sp. (in: high G+C Gram-positive bacteria) TaxID=84139 RepID=UPI00262AFB44
LAQHLGVSVRTVHEIVHGQRGVSAEMSLRLGRLFGQSDLFWLKIQMDYDLQRARGRVDLSAITPLAG